MPYENGIFRQNRGAKIKRNNLGIIGTGKSQLQGTYRKTDLEKVDQYLENRQYDHLADWYTKDSCDNLLPMRQRQPKIIYNLAKRVSDTLASKLLGPRVFPTFTLPEDPDTKALTDHLIKLSDLKAKAVDVGRFLASHGSCFLRFKFTNGFLRVERYNPNICYPQFDDAGELELIDIKYVYDDLEEKDEKGNPVKKWYKMQLGKQKDIIFDNPKFESNGSEPEFTIEKQTEHNIGFVQGQWFKVGDDSHDPDGPSLVHEILGFIDSFNYSLSQSDQAVAYNQEPQLLLNGMDNEEMSDLVKSSASAWNMGRDGKADYLETGLGGVEKASELRDRFKQNAGEITRVVLLEPEKMVGSAQSGKAMEVLYAPLLDLVDEYRPYAERGMVGFIQKMVAAVIVLNQRGFIFNGISIPVGYAPMTLSYDAVWPQVFPMTMQDLQQKVSVAVQAATGNIISRETMTAWLAKDFDILDVEEEVAKVAAQPVINPFAF